MARHLPPLHADDKIRKAHYWLWLSAQKSGGYPVIVRQDMRMDVIAGYEPTAVELEDVAAEIGLDKTCGGCGRAIFDSNGDGRLDIVQFSYSRRHDMIYTLCTGHRPSGGTPLRIFHNSYDRTWF